MGHNFIVVWLLGRSSSSSPYTKELHENVQLFQASDCLYVTWQLSSSLRTTSIAADPSRPEFPSAAAALERFCSPPWPSNDHRHLISRPSTPLKTLAQQHLLYGRCQWVQIIALNLNFPLKFIRDISSCWIKHEKESKKIGRARSIYSWSRVMTQY